MITKEKTKKCRGCREYLTYEHFQVNSAKCKPCFQSHTREKQRTYALRAQANKKVTKIPQKSKDKEKRARAHEFTYATRLFIFRRDQACVCCHSISSPNAHHVYWHSGERHLIPAEEKNTADKGVRLCTKCHTDIHAGDRKKDQLCHDYLIDLYGEVEEFRTIYFLKIQHGL